MGRWSVPEREASERSMAVTRCGSAEQVTPRHAHGDGAWWSQSERKPRGSEETCNCLKRIKRSTSEVDSVSGSAAVTVTNKAIRRREVNTIDGSCGGDHDMFLVRYGFALLIWLFWGFHSRFMEN